MSAAEAGQRSDTTLRRDEHGKFMSAQGDSGGAPPGGPSAGLSALAAPPGPGAAADKSQPHYSSLLSHCGATRRRAAPRCAALPV
jgi:hypothetical protein